MEQLGGRKQRWNAYQRHINSRLKMNSDSDFFISPQKNPKPKAEEN